MSTYSNFNDYLWIKIHATEDNIYNFVHIEYYYQRKDLLCYGCCCIIIRILYINSSWEYHDYFRPGVPKRTFQKRDLPSGWVPMNTAEEGTPLRVKLEPSDEDYIQTESHFYQTMSRADYKIVEIHKIQNLYLWRRFERYFIFPLIVQPPSYTRFIVSCQCLVDTSIYDMGYQPVGSTLKMKQSEISAHFAQDGCKGWEQCSLQLQSEIKIYMPD